jgi:glycosyltransferase involved in cell wall biosynthesis
VANRPPPHPDVIVTGPVDEDVKWAGLRGCLAFVSPSPLESFSIVLMEAWSVEKPVVVNARCHVTREHCAQSGGGLWFDGYGSFEAVVDRLVHDAGLRARMAAQGAAYVAAYYRWPVVIHRYRAFLERVAAHG